MVPPRTQEKKELLVLVALPHTLMAAL